MTRVLVRLVTLMVGLALAGCATFPTSGSVERADVARPGGRPPGIHVAAQPPEDGASPEAILEGFFSASESPGDGYAVARQYLTPEAASSWRPEAGVSVYDSTGQPRVVTSEGSAILRAPLVGRLDADQVFTSLYAPDFSHDFHMTKVDGQWRIAAPGEGVLISTQRFHRGFQAVPVYYLDPAGRRMVSQSVFLRQADIDPATPDALVRAVIAGPGTWLRPAVLDALPAEVQSSGSWMDDAGVVHISLSDEMESLSADQRLQAAAQLLYTLGYFGSVTGVQIDVNGRPLSIRGADTTGVVRVRAVEAFAPERSVAPRDVYGLRGGSVIRIGEAPGSQVTGLPGPLGGEWGDSPGRLAVSWQGDRVAVVTEDRERLYIAQTVDGLPSRVFEGSELLKPQFDPTGQLWTIDNTAGGPVAVRVGPRGNPVLLPMSDLVDVDVVAFRMSPDMTRVAVIVESDGAQRLGLLRLRGVDKLILDGWRELPLNTSQGQVSRLRDVAFVSPDRMLVLGAGPRDPAFTVYSLDVDAARVTSHGPISDVEAVSLTAMPIGAMGAVAVVTSAQRGLRYEAQYRWSMLIDGVADLAYPS